MNVRAPTPCPPGVRLRRENQSGIRRAFRDGTAAPHWGLELRHLTAQFTNHGAEL